MSLSIIGNWKSNGSLESNKSWIHDFKYSINDSEISNVAICPPFTYLDQMISLTSNLGLSIGSQDIDSSSGARTGSTSVNACKDIGCCFSIVGHSERREIFGESNMFLRQKLITAQESGFQVIFCIGEPKEQQLAGTTNNFLEKQIIESLSDLELLDGFTIAYEPIWAIGTGEIPDVKDINATHKFIKDIVQSSSKNNFTPNVLYGGSVTSKNAEVLFKEKYIDGALIGGASLNGKEFAEIANIFKNRGF
jgi:triosephosphate isomerase